MTTANHESPLGALEGIRVLDVAAPLGAFVSRILGDLGADVIKIEPPGGDPGRHLSPLLTTGQERLSLPFVHANVNKRSVILDLEQRHDQERFRTLVAQSDVVVSSEGLTAWTARGIDIERLPQCYPGLVWTSFSPFGLRGPYSAYTGNNIVRACCTAMHHFFLPRPDGTTATERFFGQKPRPMLAAMLASVELAPAPLRPPRKAYSGRRHDQGRHLHYTAACSSLLPRVR